MLLMFLAVSYGTIIWYVLVGVEANAHLTSLPNTFSIVQSCMVQLVPGVTALSTASQPRHGAAGALTS